MGKNRGKAHKGPKHQEKPKQEEMDQEGAIIEPDDIQVGDEDEEQADQPGYLDFVYHNIFFEWYYRVRQSNIVSTERRHRRRRQIR